MDQLVYRPNTILQQQKVMQADPRAVYLKTPRAKLYMGLYLAVFTVGVVGSLHGAYKMARGQKN
ncbi:hypothetical protein T439DRAFT_323584 [Meredithblackwellia eburnea MCA 4105]